MAVEGNTVGMAGQLIAATLETAGFYSLSQLLDNARPVLQSAGYFVWVWCAVGAIIAIAQFGNYRQGLYLLVCPALFMWMVDTRTAADYASQQFGERRSPNDGVRQAEVLREGNVPIRSAQIPLFIAVYDRLVSNSVQQVVAFLVDTKNKQDMLSAARERMMSRILLAKGTDPEFLRLITTSLVGQCGRVFVLEKELGSKRLAEAAAGSREAVEAEVKRRELASLKGQPIHLDDRLREFVKRLGVTPAKEPTCVDVWSYTKVAALKAAENVIQPTEAEKKATDLNAGQWNEVSKFVKEKLTQDGATAADERKAIEVLAAFYLRNSLAHSAQGAMVSQMEGHYGWDDAQQRRIYGDVAEAEAAGTHLMIVYFAAVVPYLQGVILYGLLVAFPFFAVFLVIPGRVTSFGAWIALWLWVKSWDIGFAFVAFFKDVFWELLPGAGQARSAATFREVNWDEPASILNLVYTNDPTMSMNTYYTLVGLFTLAIPAVTAHLCLGATHVYGALRMSFEGHARDVERRKSNSARVTQARRLNTKMQTNRFLASDRAFDAAVQNPGVMANGVQRANAGNGAVSDYATRKANQAEYQQIFSKQGVEDIQALAEMRRQRISGTKGEGRKMLEGERNAFNEGNAPAGWSFTGEEEPPKKRR